MKRIVSILLCISMLFSLLALTSCHGKAAIPEFEIPESIDMNKEYNIVFWAKNENHKEQQEVYRAAVEAFEALYPNVHITMKMYADYNLIYRDVITNIGTGTTPNVCITYPDHIATYNTGDNIVAPLEELMSDEKYGLGGSEILFDGVNRDEIVEVFLSEGKIAGTQYAIPFMRSTEACYVNVDLLHALGYELPETLTWDFIFEVSRAAMTPVSLDENGNNVYINGQTLMLPFIYKSVDNMMIQYLEQAGAEYSTEDGEILFFNETSEAFLADIAENATLKAFTTFNIDGYPGNYLNRGQCIFAVDSTAGATWMGANAPHLEVSEENIVDFEMAVVGIPQVDPENPKMISQGPSICVFNTADREEVVISWIFAQFLLTNEIQISYSQTEGYLPVTTKAHSSEEYQSYLAMADEMSVESEYYYAKIIASELLLKNLDNIFVTPVFNGSTSVRNAAGEMINSVVRATRRGAATDAEAIRQMYEKVATQYHLNQINVKDNISDLGAMPGESVALLVTIGTVWLGIGTAVLVPYIIKRKDR